MTGECLKGLVLVGVGDMMAWRRHPMVVHGVLVLAAVAVCVAFMTLGARGNWDFVLPFRGGKLVALVAVAVCIAVSTVLFQTVTNNPILTPSIIGFDALYILIQTSLMFGTGLAGFVAADPRAMFAFQTAVMVLASTALYGWQLGNAHEGLHRLVLIGIVIGIFFRSLASFMQRLIAPDDFLVLQDSLFANFNTIDRNLLMVGTLATCAIVAGVWRMRNVLDVLNLGREHAISLGVDYRRAVFAALVMVSVLVSVSTALVGPVLFFGLLVAHLAYRLAPSHRHADILPAAALIAIICLVGGQTLLERLFAFDTALSIIIEFIGGIVFIALLVKGVRR
jgi:iron complex transport system permease protein